MPADAAPQTDPTAAVSTIPAELAALLDKSKVSGTGTFTPPGEEPPEQPLPAEPAARRNVLLLQHKMIGIQIARLKAARAEIEDQLAQLDAHASLAMKLAGLTPAERALLEQTLAVKAQQQLDNSPAEPPGA
jgi:hypothetical protein